jgi:hypothetical protein
MSGREPTDHLPDDALAHCLEQTGEEQEAATG